MDSILPFLTDLFFVAALIAVNGFFVATEFALIRSHITKLKVPELQKKFGTASALTMIKDLDFSLSSTQLGITVASLLLGWWGELTLSRAFLSVAAALALPLSEIIAHAIATIVALAIVTALHVIIGELAAKSVAIRYPEETLRFLAPFMRVLSGTFRPCIYILNESANLFLRIFGLRTVAESERAHSSNELSLLIEQSSEHGVIDKNEEEMLKGIFGFSETVAREIMTPRTDLITIPVSSTFEEALAIISRSGFSRFPITGENIDDIKGLLLSRDMLAAVPEYMKSGGKVFHLEALMRECYFVPGTKPIDDLLNELKRRKIHMAIVLDEHGGVDGAITLEDILEEIVGDIYDESDAPPHDVVIQDDGDILFDGGLLVEDVNERFGLTIPVGDYDTVAGFMLSALGRKSKPGDKVTLRGKHIVAVNNRVLDLNGHQDGAANFERLEAILTVETVEGNRIETIRVKKIELAPPPSEEDKESSAEAIDTEIKS
jgi:CBS domain containing-hemolysin-like protein